MNPLRRLLLSLVLLTSVLGPLTSVSVRAADISITAGSVVASTSADRTFGTAGVAITAGQSCYLDPATNSWKLADANAATPLYKIGGIAINNAAAGQPVAICTKDDSFTLGGTVASGAIVILSATPGGLCVVDTTVPQPTSGWYVQIVGVGIGSNKIKFNMLRSDSAVP